MKISEKFSFQNEKYAKIQEISKKVIMSYQTANRWTDSLQEYVYIQYGMPSLARVIHNLAHTFPQKFDKFVDMLHERHLMAIYGATSEVDIAQKIQSFEDVFGFVINILDNIQETLAEFHSLVDNSDLMPMALKVEELMVENSAEYTPFLEMWSRWENNGGSFTSFDNWCKRYL